MLVAISIEDDDKNEGAAPRADRRQLGEHSSRQDDLLATGGAEPSLLDAAADPLDQAPRPAQ